MRTKYVAAFLALAPAVFAATTFTSADGNFTLTAQDDGKVVGPGNRCVMTLGADGSCYRWDGELMCKVVGNTIYDREGNVIATIETDGTVVSKRVLGRIAGTQVYDNDGELLGTLSDTSARAKQLALMVLRRANRGPKGGPGYGPGGPPGGRWGGPSPRGGWGPPEGEIAPPGLPDEGF